MFRALISFSRLFSLRRRRPAKADPVSSSTALSAPPPVIHTATPTTPPHQQHSLCPTPIALSRLPASPATLTSLDVPSLRVILIERLVDEPTLNVPPPPAHAPPANVAARSPTKANGTSHARYVSFQLPPTTKLVDADTRADSEPDSDADTDPSEDGPATPSSTCSTLVGAQSQAKGEVALPMAVPEEQPPAYTRSTVTLASTPGSPVSPSTSAKARHMSFFHLQPVRKDVARFSMPVRPAAGTGINTTATDNRRASAMPLASGSAMTKREKRMTRWSKELNKPGTQEVLMALRGL